MEIKLSKKEILLLLESIDVYFDEYSGVSYFEEKTREKLEKLLKKIKKLSVDK